MARAKKENKKANKKSKGKKKGNVVTLDFTGVKSFKAIPEGTYLARVTSAEQGEASSGNPIISLELEVAEGKHEGAKLWHTLVLTDNAMWKVREAMEAMGQDTPDGEVDIDLDDLVGVEVGVITFHDTYENNTKSKISDFVSKDDVDAETEEDEDDEEDETPPKGKTNKKSGKKPAKDEDEEEDEEVDVSSMDEDELAELIEERGLDVDLDDYSSIKKKRAAVADALEGSEDDEEEDSEEYTEDQINEMDVDELSSLNDDLDLEVEDIEDMKVKQARKAVLKALKKKKLLAK